MENYEQVLPAAEYIEGMQRLSRDITPLLSSSQQGQICTLSLQHHSRLHSQRQLHDNLQLTLDLAGTPCKHLYHAFLTYNHPCMPNGQMPAYGSNLQGRLLDLAQEGLKVKVCCREDLLVLCGWHAKRAQISLPRLGPFKVLVQAVVKEGS